MDGLKVRYEGKRRFKVNVRRHEFAVDLPVENGGEDNGPTPPELLIASLGTCIGVYVVNYLEGAKLNSSGMEINLGWEKAKDQPARISQVTVEISLPGADAAGREKGILGVAERCLVHNTLTHAPQIKIGLKKG